MYGNNPYTVVMFSEEIKQTPLSMLIVERTPRRSGDGDAAVLEEM
jgi:hypothetical protein